VISIVEGNFLMINCKLEWNRFSRDQAYHVKKETTQESAMYFVDPSALLKNYLMSFLWDVQIIS
jgi:hypothetical protein